MGRFGLHAMGIRGAMRFFLWGIAIAVAIYLLSAGHILFLPLLFFLPLGGMLGGRRRRRRAGFFG